jgi:hypothetical protein
MGHVVRETFSCGAAAVQWPSLFHKGGKVQPVVEPGSARLANAAATERISAAVGM